jgi:hypothetical protein
VVLVVGAGELVEVLLADLLGLVIEQAAIPRAKRTRTETVDRDLTSTDRRPTRGMSWSQGEDLKMGDSFDAYARGRGGD